MGFFDNELMGRIGAQYADLQQYLSSDRKFFGRIGILKRTMDISISVVALIFLLPVFCFVAIAIKLTSDGPVFYRQERLGRFGQLFSIYKFRSMHLDGDNKLQALLASCPVSKANWDKYQKLKNDPRITRIGAFLRKTSIDELPQIINVLRGEMSIVGQRPLLPDQQMIYGIDNYLHYIRSRPGITGLWQVSGRNALPFERRAELDLEYSEKWSIWFDLKIIFMTLPALLFPKGAY